MNYCTRLMLVLLSAQIACHTFAGTETNKLPHSGQAVPANSEEQWLDKVMIDEVGFRAANIFDCIEFIQHQLNEYTSEMERVAPRFVYDIEAIRYIEHCDKGEPQPPLPTFTARNISAFRLMKILEAVSDIRFVATQNLIVVEKTNIKPVNLPVTFPK